MNCPQCNTILPDSATFCTRCGTSIRPGSFSFSYLPAGAPPWPMTVPPPSFFAVSTPTATSSAQAAGQDVGVSAAPKASKPKRSTASALVLVALLILSPLLGIGAAFGILLANGQFSSGSGATKVSLHPQAQPSSTAQPSGGATPTTTGDQLPTPSSFQTINIPDLGISLKYPSDWQKLGPTQTSADAVEVALRPQQQIGIDFRIKRISTSASASLASAAAANQANLAAFARFQGVSNLQATTTEQRTIAGRQWAEQDATFTDPNNLPYDLASISVLHNKFYYTIYFYSPDMYYQEALQKYIQPILDSFQFLS
jgi:hypothetical protein